MSFGRLCAMWPNDDLAYPYLHLSVTLRPPLDCWAGVAVHPNLTLIASRKTCYRWTSWTLCNQVRAAETSPIPSRPLLSKWVYSLLLASSLGARIKDGRIIFSTCGDLTKLSPSSSPPMPSTLLWRDCLSLYDMARVDGIYRPSSGISVFGIIIQVL